MPIFAVFLIAVASGFFAAFSAGRASIHGGRAGDDYHTRDEQHAAKLREQAWEGAALASAIVFVIAVAVLLAAVGRWIWAVIG